MASVLPSTEDGVAERLLPLRHWLGADAGRNAEQEQARTRLLCTLLGLSGLVLASLVVDLPGVVVAIAIAYPLYAIALAMHIARRPAPSRWRRGVAGLLDNLIGSAIAYSGGGFRGLRRLSTSSPRWAGACASGGTICSSPRRSRSAAWRSTRRSAPTGRGVRWRRARSLRP